MIKVLHWVSIQFTKKSGRISLKRSQTHGLQTRAHIIPIAVFLQACAAWVRANQIERFKSTSVLLPRLFIRWTVATWQFPRGYETASQTEVSEGTRCKIAGDPYFCTRNTFHAGKIIQFMQHSAISVMPVSIALHGNRTNCKMCVSRPTTLYQRQMHQGADRGKTWLYELKTVRMSAWITHTETFRQCRRAMKVGYWELLQRLGTVAANQCTRQQAENIRPHVSDVG